MAARRACGCTMRHWCEATPTNIRDSVGIDRRTGAAARVESIKFDLEVLPAGTAFDLRLELEDPSGLDEPLLAAVLAEWQAGRAALGGPRARGLGAFALDNLGCSRRDLSAADALISFLRSDDPLAGLAEEEQWLAQGITAARQAVRPGPAEPHTAQSWIEVEMTLGRRRGRCWPATSRVPAAPVSTMRP